MIREILVPLGTGDRENVLRRVRPVLVMGGLALIPRQIIVDGSYTDDDGAWNITHVGSGRRLGFTSYFDIGDATAVMKDLAPLAAWTLPFESLRKIEGLSRRVMEVVDRHGARLTGEGKVVRCESCLTYVPAPLKPSGLADCRDCDGSSGALG